jgi:hypothetical protein
MMPPNRRSVPVTAEIRAAIRAPAMAPRHASPWSAKYIGTQVRTVPSGRRPWGRRAKQAPRPQFTIYYSPFTIHNFDGGSHT